MEVSGQSEGIAELILQLRQFAAERDWQGFHTPKNLASALVVEAAELLEPFQWLVSGEQQELGAEQYQAVRLEMADVFCYLLMLADRLEVDLVSACRQKIGMNAEKYPVELARGRAEKYSHYQRKK